METSHVHSPTTTDPALLGLAAAEIARLGVPYLVLARDGQAAARAVDLVTRQADLIAALQRQVAQLQAALGNGPARPLTLTDVQPGMARSIGGGQ